MPLLIDAELIFYAVASAAGLIIAVYAMLHGSARVSYTSGSIKPPPAAFNTPVVGAALLCFGAVGYLVTKYSHLGTIWVLTVALVAAAAGWIGMTLLMARWALRGPLHNPHEELEELQGTVATVTQTITPEALGEIAYTFRGAPATAQARSINREAVVAGTEVVIDTIENGIADVELWSVVEQRL
jgi:hypothetical protein